MKNSYCQLSSTVLYYTKYFDSQKNSNISNINELHSFNAKIIISKSNKIVKTLNTTDNPITFFEHVDIYRNFLNSIQKYYNKKLLNRTSPKTQLENFDKTLPFQVNLMIQRYVEKTEIKLLNLKTHTSKINNLNVFLNTLDHHSNRMNPININLYKRIYQELTNKYILNMKPMEIFSVTIVVKR
ncbi:MAG: hypothetical protein Q4D02_01620 [Clostridia bacterium]|nr:hypothetical protein [Clostridia bacterium]